MRRLQTAPMRVLVTGAYGFIGAHVVAALLAAGHTVTCAVRGSRRGERFPGIAHIACNFARDVRPGDWLPRLDGIDAVVNAAGILRETRADRFEAIHHDAPLALAQACAARGIRRFVQISALGDPRDGEFIASKHRFDAALLALDLDALVIRPSLVYATRGSYGGTSLLRALAALPFILPLPGQGDAAVQPIDAEDVGRGVALAFGMTTPPRDIAEWGGPEVMTLREYLLAWRHWLGFGSVRTVPVPWPLIGLAARLGENFGSGPLGITMQRMLRRGNVVGPMPPGTATIKHFAPRTLGDALRRTPSLVQDRWHARLYLIAPLLRVSLAVTWIVSGMIGLGADADTMRPVLDDTVFAPATWKPLAMLTGLADLALGLWLLVGRAPRPALGAMLLMTLGYTLGLGLLKPMLWIEPLGGLLKNLPLLAALGAAWATAERR